jgi:hypothetical protein
MSKKECNAAQIYKLICDSRRIVVLEGIVCICVIDSTQWDRYHRTMQKSDFYNISELSSSTGCGAVHDVHQLAALQEMLCCLGVYDATHDGKARLIMTFFSSAQRCEKGKRLRLLCYRKRNMVATLHSATKEIFQGIEA